MLQHLSDDRWADVRRIRLKTVDARSFEATFTVRTEGLTLRVLLPTRTARPCYNAGVSEIFRS